jgi:stage V sporulation protein G
MEITEVRVKLVEDNNERLKAFCSVTLDGDFVIRDLKIIDGTNGSFVAMPSRKLTDRCPKCGTKNHYRARFCNECGARLGENRAPRGGDGRMRLHADVAHPINSPCRERIQKAVIKAYNEEVDRSKQPGYVPPRLEDDDYNDTDYDSLIADLREDARHRNRGRESSAGQPANDRPTSEAHDAQDKAGPPPSSESQPDDFAAGIS